MDYAKVLLGWLLGLLSLGIVAFIRRKFRQKELKESLVGEQRDLRYRMAAAAHHVSTHQGLDTDELLDWLLSTMRAYDGPLAIPEHLEAIRQARKIRPEDRSAAYQRLRQGPGLSLKEYHLPLLNATGSELAICPLPFQRSVLRIAEELRLYNQRVKYLTNQFDRTFDSGISPTNHQAITSNLDKGYRELPSAARRIADLIGKLEADFSR